MPFGDKKKIRTVFFGGWPHPHSEKEREDVFLDYSPRVGNSTKMLVIVSKEIPSK